MTESQNNNTSRTSETNGDQQPKDKKANKSALSLLQAYDSSDSESYDSQSDSEEEEDNDVDEISDNSDMDIRRQISQFIKPRKENVAVPVNDGYRDVKPFRMIRGDDDSDSESSDSNSDTNNDVIHVPASAVKEPESVVVMESNSEEEDNAETPGTVKKKRDPLRVKGELMIEDLPPIEDLKISVPEDECTIVGFVSSIVDRLGKIWFK